MQTCGCPPRAIRTIRCFPMATCGVAAALALYRMADSYRLAASMSEFAGETHRFPPSACRQEIGGNFFDFLTGN